MPDSPDSHDQRELQLDTIVAEYYRAEAAGQAPDHNEFIAQHPEFAKELAEFFADVVMLHDQDRPDLQDPALEPTITPNKSLQKHSSAASEVRYLGEYEILDELGAGGIGVVQKTFEGHSGWVHSVAVASRRELARGIGSGELRGLSVASDGKSCVTAGLDGSLWEWEIPEIMEPLPGTTEGRTPEMLTNEAFQAHYLEKRKLLLRPMHVFVGGVRVVFHPRSGERL